jgi:hypothetical protein
MLLNVTSLIPSLIKIHVAVLDFKTANKWPDILHQPYMLLLGVHHTKIVHAFFVLLFELLPVDSTTRTLAKVICLS